MPCATLLEFSDVLLGVIEVSPSDSDDCPSEGFEYALSSTFFLFRAVDFFQCIAVFRSSVEFKRNHEIG